MSSRGGGVGLGLVAGWLLASVPLPRGPGRAGVLLLALGPLVAETALLGDGGTAGWCLAAVTLGFALGRGFRLAAGRGGGA